MFKIMGLIVVLFIVIYYILLFGSIFMPKVFPRLADYDEDNVSYLPFKYLFKNNKNNEEDE